MGKRTPIGKFIHSTWANLNIRAGKYRHLRTESKCKCYDTIKIEFNRNEFKDWCLKNQSNILSCTRPSIDRIDVNGHYTLENIRVIELFDNISCKRPGNNFINGKKSKTIRGVSKSGKKWRARITIDCKERHLGSFNTKEEALEVFFREYKIVHNREPW